MNGTEISPIVQEQWRTIAGLLENEFDSARVTISQDSGQFVCKSAVHLLDWVPDFLSCLLPNAYCLENQKTIQYLFTYFGHERVVRIFRRFDIDINHRYIYGQSVTREDIHKLFVGLGHVFKEDMIQIFADIQTPRARYLHLPPEELARLKRQFAGKRFVDLAKVDLDEIYKVAVPFTNVATMFFNHPPQKDRSGHNKGGDFWEVRDVVYFSEWIRRGALVLDARTHLADYYSLKQLLGPFTPHGLVIPSVDGYRYVWRKDDNAMVRAIFLQTLTQRQGPNFDNQIALLSTQFWSNAKRKWGGWTEDLRLCMGSQAIITKFEEWKRLLTPAEKGFLRNGRQGIEVIGYSLGGVQAQRLAAALLPLNIVKKLTVVCSPGVDDATAEWYRKHCQGFSTSPEIHVVRNRGDSIGELGDQMLGAGCDNAFCEILVPWDVLDPKMTVESVLQERVESAVCWLWGIISIIWSLFAAHREEFLYRGSCSFQTTARASSNAFINKGLGYEEARQMVAFGKKDEFIKFLHDLYPTLR